MCSAFMAQRLMDALIMVSAGYFCGKNLDKYINRKPEDEHAWIWLTGIFIWVFLIMFRY